MPTDDEYRQLYDMSYFAAAGASSAPRWLGDYAAVPYGEALTEARINSYRARLRRLAGVFPDRGTLLDVGMATGEFAAMALADGWRVSGLDISAEACRLASQRGVEAHCGNLLTASLKSRLFDVVHLNHVFEHFTDPRAALAKLAEFLTPKSLLVLEVPSQFDSWTRRLVNSIRVLSKRQTQRSVLSIHHPYFYSRGSITSLLSDCHGMEIVWCRTYFPERWSGPAYRQVLRLIDFLADRAGHYGENIEIAARLGSYQSASRGASV